MRRSTRSDRYLEELLDWGGLSKAWTIHYSAAQKAKRKKAAEQKLKNAQDKQVEIAGKLNLTAAQAAQKFKEWKLMSEYGEAEIIIAAQTLALKTM